VVLRGSGVLVGMLERENEGRQRKGLTCWSSCERMVVEAEGNNNGGSHGIHD
jgi:hypothetical protein